MSDTITYTEMHKQACVRREVYVELHRLVESISHGPVSVSSEHKLQRICEALKTRASLAGDLVATSWSLSRGVNQL